MVVTDLDLENPGEDKDGLDGILISCVGICSFIGFSVKGLFCHYILTSAPKGRPVNLLIFFDQVKYLLDFVKVFHSFQSDSNQTGNPATVRTISCLLGAAIRNQNHDHRSTGWIRVLLRSVLATVRLLVNIGFWWPGHDLLQAPHL